jgi:hypothetical protein
LQGNENQFYLQLKIKYFFLSVLQLPWNLSSKSASVNKLSTASFRLSNFVLQCHRNDWKWVFEMLHFVNDTYCMNVVRFIGSNWTNFGSNFSKSAKMWPCSIEFRTSLITLSLYKWWALFLSWNHSGSQHIFELWKGP